MLSNEASLILPKLTLVAMVLAFVNFGKKFYRSGRSSSSSSNSNVYVTSLGGDMHSHECLLVCFCFRHYHYHYLMSFVWLYHNS